MDKQTNTQPLLTRRQRKAIERRTPDTGYSWCDAHPDTVLCVGKLDEIDYAAVRKALPGYTDWRAELARLVMESVETA